MDALFSKFRMKVSADKVRYRDGSHDLDLTYITDRLIGALSWLLSFLCHENLIISFFSVSH